MASPLQQADTYAFLKYAYENRPKELEGLSLDKFVEVGSQATGNNVFNQARNAGFLRDTGFGIDVLLEEAGVRQLGRSAGGFLGDLIVNDRELGEQIGADLPRGVLNTIPMIAGGGVGALASGLLSAQQSFQYSGDPVRALASGATMALAPKVIGNITPALGSKLLPNVAEKLTSKMVPGVASKFTGNLLDSFLYGVGSDMIDIGLAEDRQFGEILTTDFWKAHTLGNVAFVPFDVAQAYRGQKVSMEERARNAIIDDRNITSTETTNLGRQRKFATGEYPTAQGEGSAMVPQSMLPTRSSIENTFNANVGAFGPSVRFQGTDPELRVISRQMTDKADPHSMEYLLDPSKADFTELGRPLEKPRPFEFGPGIAEKLNLSREKRPRDLFKFSKEREKAELELEELLGSPGVKRVEDNANISPRDLSEFEGQLLTTNQFLMLANKMPLMSATMAHAMAKHVNDNWIKPTHERVLQQKKNEALLEVEKLKNTSDGYKLLKTLDSVKDQLPEKVFSTLRTRIENNKDVPEYLDQLYKEIREWRVAGGTDVADLRRRLNNAKSRVSKALKRSEESPKKAGRKTNIQAEDLTDLWARVKALDKDRVVVKGKKSPPKMETQVSKAFALFTSKAARFQDTSDTTLRGMNTINNWLNRSDGKVTIKNLRGMLSRELERYQNEFNIARKRKKLDSYEQLEEFRIQRDIADEMFNEDFNNVKFNDEGDLDYDTYYGNNGETAINIAAKTMLREGHTPGHAAEMAPEVANVVRMFEQLTGQEVQVGRLVGANGNLRGLSSRSALMNKVFIDPTLKGMRAKFVAAHEILGHQLQKLYNAGQLDAKTAKVYARFAKHIEEMPVAERREILNDLTDQYVPKHLREDLKAEYATDRAVTVDETIANISSLLALASSSKADLPGFMMFMPQRVYDFAVTAIRWAKSVADSLLTYAGINSLRGIKHKGFKEIADFKKILDKVTNELVEQDAAARKEFGAMQRSQVGGLSRMFDDEWIDASELTFSGNETTGGMLADAMFLGEKRYRDVLVNSIEGIMHKLERYPDLVRLQHAFRAEGMEHHALTRDIALNMFTENDPGPNGIGPKTGEVEVGRRGNIKINKDLGPVGRVLDDRKASIALDEALLWQNKTDQNYFKASESDRNKLMEGLTQQQRNNVEGALARFQSTMRDMQTRILESEQNNEVYNLANIIRDKLEGSNEQVLRTAEELIKAYKKSPQSYKFMADQLGLDPEGPEIYIKASEARLEKMAETFKDREFFVSAEHMKRYHVSFKRRNAKTDGRRSFDTMEAAIAYARQLKKDGAKLFYAGEGVLDTNRRFTPNRRQSDLMLELLNTAEDKTTMQVLEQQVAKGNITPEAYDAIVKSRSNFKTVLQEEFLRTEVTKPTGMARMWKDGHEELNYAEQMMLYLNKMATKIPRTKTDTRLRFEEKDPRILNSTRNQKGLQDLKKGIENYRRSDTALGNAFTRANFLHFLGFNTSSALIETSQFFIHLSPKLKEEGASLIDAYKLPVKAAQQLIKPIKEWNSGVKVGDSGADLYQKLILKAEHENRVGLGVQQDVLDANHHYMTDLGRVANGAKPEGALSLTRAHSAAVNVASQIYGIATGFNERVSLLSAMDMKIKQMGNPKKISERQFQELYDDVVRIAAIANSSDGRINRPTALFAGEGFGRTMAQIVYSLGSFNSGMISNAIRYYQKGFTNHIEGLTPKQKADAKQAAIMSTVSTVAIAGIIGGLPFAGLLSGVLQNQFHIDTEKVVREWMHKLGGEEMGNWLADAGTHGVAYAMGLPFDISSRTSYGGFLGMNAYEGWSPKAFFGPTANLAADYWDAALHASNGDFTESVKKAMPLGLRKMFELYNDSGVIKNSKGKIMLSDVTDAEKIAYTVGFAPRRLTEQRIIDRSEQLATNAARDRNEKFERKFIRTYKEDGPGAAQIELQQFVESTGRTYDPNSAIRKLKEEINLRRDGYDPRLTGNLQIANHMLELLATMNTTQIPYSSLVDRAISDQQVEMSMGLMPNPTRSMNQMQQASVVEMLRSQSNLPVPVLNQVAQSLLTPAQTTQSMDLLRIFANSARRP